jgi:hypothetical protein
MAKIVHPLLTRPGRRILGGYFVGLFVSRKHGGVLFHADTSESTGIGWEETARFGGEVTGKEE